MKQLRLVPYAIVLGTCLMLSATLAHAQSDPEKMKLIEQEAVGWSRNMDQLMAVFAEDVIYEDAPMGLVLHGKEELRGFATSFFNGFPTDLKAVITTAVVDGNHGASEWRFTGTHSGDMPNMPASNKTMDVRGASIYEFEGGKIKHKIDYWDLSTMLRQLGFMPAKQ
jgi:steroid delta-isomerase-like uncharacterized protein